MLKKLRCKYWALRDRGKGRQVKMFVLLFLISVIALGALGVNKVVNMRTTKYAHTESEKYAQDVGVASGSAVSGDAISTQDSTYIEDDNAHIDGAKDADNGVESIPIDMSSLDSFLGFMTDASYQNMTNQLTQICQEKQSSNVKKLSYQITKEDSFLVSSFVMLVDGSVYQIDYDLKSDTVVVSPTSYTEVDIQKMKDEAEALEIEKLQKEQQEAKEKAEQEALESASDTTAKKAANKDKKAKKKQNKKSNKGRAKGRKK